MLAAVLALAAVAGCGTGAGEPGAGRTLTVFAAASLTEVFGELERRFEADHAGVDVRLSYQGSSAIAQQLINGAVADVFASADERTMSTVADAGLVRGQPVVFATNRLTIAVPNGNPAGIRSLADLADPARDDLAVVVCAPQVPCGAATERVLRASGVPLRPVSEEQDVKAVLTKVLAGEADAGLVYVTDVRAAAGEVTAVDFPESGQAVNSYPIATLADAAEPELAREFVALVRGEFGRERLTEAGFGVP